MCNTSFSVGDPVKKVGGSYEATGIIRSIFHCSGGYRVVVEFDVPKGLLHIFNLNQLEPLDYGV